MQYIILMYMCVRKFHTCRKMAERIGQAFIELKWLKIISSTDQQFRGENSVFLTFGEAASLPVSDSSNNLPALGAPNWFQRLPEDGSMSEVEVSMGSIGSSGVVSWKRQDNINYSLGTNSITDTMSIVFDEPSITVSTLEELTGNELKSSGGGGGGTNSDNYIVVKQSSHGTDDSNEDITLTYQEDEHSSQFTPSFSLVQADFIPSMSASTLRSKDSSCDSKALQLLKKIHNQHFDAIIRQFMKTNGLSCAWLDIIKPIVMEASREVKTNVTTEDVMNINEYVKMKKIPGGRREDCSLIYGVVCTKNVTHKKMKCHLKNPSILLLQCALEFQRRENQLSSFDILQLQEEKYLRNLVARIKSFRPEVILVQKSVSRIALQMLHNLGIVVAVNVKPSVMARVARGTQGTLLYSLDQLFLDFKLGTCGNFYIRSFTLPNASKKTLMYFDNCESRLGCVVTLQGGSIHELRKVKRVAQFALYVAHNSFLECPYLSDECAWPETDCGFESNSDYSTASATPEALLYPAVAYPKGGIAPEDLARELSALQSEGGGEVESDDEKHKDDEADREETLVTDGPDTECTSAKQEEAPGEKTRVLSEEMLTLVRNSEDKFIQSMRSTMLSVSPGVEFSPPYLQTKSGMTANIRQYLPSVIYWSSHFQEAKSSPDKKAVSDQKEDGLTMRMLRRESFKAPLTERQRNNSGSETVHFYKSVAEHPLTTSVIMLKADTSEMKAALADFRARAGLEQENNCFFFNSAKVVADYGVQLKNLFNKYNLSLPAVADDYTGAYNVHMVLCGMKCTPCVCIRTDALLSCLKYNVHVIM